MARPGVVQQLIETQLAQAFRSLSPLVSDECYVSMKQFMCGSYFLVPVGKTLPGLFTENGQAAIVPLIPTILSTYVAAYPYMNVTQWITDVAYVPSYPHFSVCSQYRSDCATVIEYGRTLNPLIVADCEKRTNGLINFPNTTQVIGHVTVAPLNLILNVNTDPNHMTMVNRTLQKLQYEPIAVGDDVPGQCVPLTVASAAEAVQTMCYGIVSYPYFLPNNMTTGTWRRSSYDRRG